VALLENIFLIKLGNRDHVGSLPPVVHDGREVSWCLVDSGGGAVTWGVVGGKTGVGAHGVVGDVAAVFLKGAVLHFWIFILGDVEETGVRDHIVDLVVWHTVVLKLVVQLYLHCFGKYGNSYFLVLNLIIIIKSMIILL